MKPKTLIRRGLVRKGSGLRSKGLKRSHGAYKRSGGTLQAGSKVKKRRKKGELTKAKLRLWELCKQITRAECIKKYGKLVCFTSGKTLIFPKDAHTGHYITSSWCSPELRYDLKNLRIQSYDENINKNGNTLQFRENLIRDHGTEYVDELWNRNKATKGRPYPLQWFLDKETEYKQLLQELKHLSTGSN